MDECKEMTQLRKFVAWERENVPGKRHVADWALSEIERLRALLHDYLGYARCAAAVRDDDREYAWIKKAEAALRGGKHE